MNRTSNVAPEEPALVEIRTFRSHAEQVARFPFRKAMTDGLRSTTKIPIPCWPVKSVTSYRY